MISLFFLKLLSEILGDFTILDVLGYFVILLRFINVNNTV